jgi:hypothetical protein
MAPLATGRAEERAMDDVQPRKITGILGHFGRVTSEWHQVQVESEKGWDSHHGSLIVTDQFCWHFQQCRLVVMSYARRTNANRELN